jgi:hypothetical protein
VLELQESHRGGLAARSDADTLARVTGLPATVWVGAFLAATLAALVVGAAWLLGWQVG